MKKLTSELLKTLRTCSEAGDVYAARGNSLSVTFHAGELQSIERNNTEGVSVRLVSQKRTGASSIIGDLGPGLDVQARTKLVEGALATSAYGREAKFVLKKRAPKAMNLDLYDPRIEKLKDIELVRIGRSIIKVLKRINRGLNVDVSFSASSGRSAIANTKGFFGERMGTYISVYVGTNQIMGTEMIDIWEYETSARYLTDLGPLLDRLIQKVRWSQKSTTVENKKYPVIFTPKGFSDFFTASLLGAVQGRAVLEGSSPLSKKLGVKVVSSKFTLFEDPFLRGRPASRTFDDEGVPCAKHPIYEKGVVQNFIYDLQTAGEAGASPTGNGSRGLSNLPTAGFSNLVINAGRGSFYEMVASLGEGIIVDQIMGAWAGNVQGGFISGQVHLGYLVKNGKVVGRVKDAMVSGNVYELLSGNIRLTKERIWTHGGGGLLCPYILVPDVSISTAK